VIYELRDHKTKKIYSCNTLKEVSEKIAAIKKATL
jgi:hypothetical protein